MFGATAEAKGELIKEVGRRHLPVI